jgi:AraC-like DNA-binding protein
MESIAREVGYASVSALSNAFKRVAGLAPRDYRRAAGVAGRSADGEPVGGG